MCGRHQMRYTKKTGKSIASIEIKFQIAWIWWKLNVNVYWIRFKSEFHWFSTFRCIFARFVTWNTKANDSAAEINFLHNAIASKTNIEIVIHFVCAIFIEIFSLIKFNFHSWPFAISVSFSLYYLLKHWTSELWIDVTWIAFFKWKFLWSEKHVCRCIEYQTYSNKFNETIVFYSYSFSTFPHLIARGRVLVFAQEPLRWIHLNF